MNNCVKCNKETNVLSYDNYCWDCFKNTEYTPSKIVSNIIQLNSPISIDNIIEKINADVVFFDINITKDIIKKIIKDLIKVDLIIENSEGLIEWNTNAKSVMKP